VLSWWLVVFLEFEGKEVDSAPDVAGDDFPSAGERATEHDRVTREGSHERSRFRLPDLQRLVRRGGAAPGLFAGRT
jgi:hypothetical protein